MDSATLDGLKMAAVNEGVNDLAGIDVMLIIIAVSLVIHILSLKSCSTTV